MKKRLAILSSHPIQYNAPMFALLAKSDILEIKVFYTWSQSKESLFDKDFGHEIKWDIPLLEGYASEFVENVSANPGPGSFKGIDCPSLIQSIKAWKPQAILVFGWNYKAHFSAMRYFKGKIPVYFRGDSTLIDEQGGYKQLIRRVFLTWVYHYVDGAFYVGKNNRDYFLKHGLKPHELFYAPHAIDNQRFSDVLTNSSELAAKWRNNLGIPLEATVVLFVGKFEPKKNPLLLLQVALSMANTGVHFVFVGNGLYEGDMHLLADKQSHIHFLPFQNQSLMPEVYNMADILALPSQGPGETWGLVLNEAMACKLAVLSSTKVGASVDLVEKGVNGFVFTSGSMQECESCLREMCIDKTKLNRMKEASYKRIQAWSFAEIVKSIENQLNKPTSTK